jgi:Fe-Mn family superoxide dismutase
MINAAFGSYDNFKKEFAQTCVTQFGSGWGWLVAEGNAVKLVKTPNAENPMTKGQKPLLTIDVWEHAYYLDYQNRRPDFVNAVIDKLINWNFAEENLLKA